MKCSALYHYRNPDSLTAPIPFLPVPAYNPRNCAQEGTAYPVHKDILTCTFRSGGNFRSSSSFPAMPVSAMPETEHGAASGTYGHSY